MKIVVLALFIAVFINAHENNGSRTLNSLTTTTITTPPPTPAPLRVPEMICPPHGMGRHIEPISADPEPEFEQVFETRINHGSILVHTDEERNNHINANHRLGIGPYIYAGSATDASIYCGRNTSLKVEVYIAGLTEVFDPANATIADTKRAFFELAQLTSDDENFYQYFYSVMGPGTFYTGLGLKPGVTRNTMLDLLARKGIKLLFSYSYPTVNPSGQTVTAYADFARIGYTYHEIVSGDGIYLP